MEFFDNALLGLSTALTFQNLTYAFVGCLLGTLIGVLPGLGPLATISMLLPLTYSLDPTAALIMLAGIYYGAQYGGSTTAILVNLPGESSAVVTALDGYQMARQGRAGVALATAAISSFIAGTFATIFIMALARPLAQIAFSFGPGEYLAMMVVGLILATVLSNARLIESLAMVLVGILLSTIGLDAVSADERFTFGAMKLFDGLDFVVMAMAVFGFAEIVKNLSDTGEGPTGTAKISRLMPSRSELAEMTPPAARGTLLGSFLGVLPGGGAALASFASYAMEKRLSKRPMNFGRGEIAGVAGPEAANNAASQTSFIPLLTLGIPSNAVMALMVGAMMIHDIVPGPKVMETNPTLIWGLIASMWIGNVILVVLNLPLVGVWVKLLAVPYRMLFPAIVILCCIGAFSLKNDSFEVLLCAGMLIAGYAIVLMGLPPAPLLMGFVLGPMMEESLRRVLLISRGDAMAVFSSPISVGFYLLAAGALVAMALPNFRKKRAVMEE